MPILKTVGHILGGIKQKLLQARLSVHAELGNKVVFVLLHRTGSRAQLGGNLAVVAAFFGPIQHVQLRWSEKNGLTDQENVQSGQ